MRLSCIISIFLFAASSIEVSARPEKSAEPVPCAAEPSECVRDLARLDSLRLEAVRYERLAFDSFDPRESSLALIDKAGCLLEAGLPSGAAEALGRVRAYALDENQRRDVTILKARCAYETGDYGSALSLLAQAGIEVPCDEPKLKSPWAGMFLTFLVPAGYIYAGSPLEGLVSTGLNGVAVLWTVSQILGGCYVSGIFGGALALNSTFFGAQQRVASLLEERNSEILSEAQRAALADALGL